MSKYKTDLDLEAIKEYYAHPDILKHLVESAQNKECVGSFGGTGYAKRPDTLYYEQDILAQVNKGVTSFHFSEETWQDPLRLQTGMSKKDQEELRIGWDLILDVDCALFEYSQLAAQLIVDVLRYYDIKAISVKFSGNHGFHIGVPFESMPEFINAKATKILFPEAPRKIAELIKHKIEPKNGQGKLSQAILELENTKNEDINAVIQRISTKTNKTFEELTTVTKDEFGNNTTKFNAFNILEIDTILISSRHLCRAPYSVNEKSGLVSLPINPDKIKQFDKTVATIQNKLVSRFVFLDRSQSIKGEATRLLTESYDFAPATEEKTTAKEFVALDQAIPQELFPPLIKKLLEGNIADGKKRTLFVLGGFLTNAGWAKDDIVTLLNEWNATHPEPLREGYMRGQLQHMLASKPLPPNYKQLADYISTPPTQEELKFKNPIVYAKAKFDLLAKKKTRQKLTEQEKEARRLHRAKQKATSNIDSPTTATQHQK